MRRSGRWIALCCAGVAAALSLAGCRAGGAGSERDEKGSIGGNTADAEKGMGRYMERELTVPGLEDLPDGYPNVWLQQEDGKLVLGEPYGGRYVSADHGESWKNAGCLWENLKADHYISDIALSPDGAAAVICSVYEDEDSLGGTEAENEEAEVRETEENAESAQSAGEESDGETEKAEDPEEEDENAAFPGLRWEYYYYDPAGEITEVLFQTGTDDFISDFGFDRQGRLYGYATDHRVYRFDPETGTVKELFEVEGMVEFACFTEKYMVAFTSRNKAVVYDLEEELLAGEDQALQDFVDENTGQSVVSMNDGHDIIAAPGEQEDIIYLAVKGGLYRYVLGGTVMEQIIDGNLNTLGDPNLALLDMAKLPENTFVVLYTGGKLFKYSYDPDVPTVPEHQLNVYSLTENYALRQAASLFQKRRPDVYVRYEIGMSDSSVTRDDAVRNLNTKIMAGEGPDILLLDGLPRASYEEKGVLADVSGAVDSMSGDAAVFPNVVDAYRKDGKLYALPVRIQIPAAVGEDKYVQKIKDLGTLADAAEEMRGENPEGALLGLRSPRQVLDVLSITSSGAWTDEKGNIDEKAVEEFLTAAVRIWQTELSGVDEKELEEEQNYSGSFSEGGLYYRTASTHALNISKDKEKLGIGKLYRVDYDYALLISIAELDDHFGYRFWNGQVENGFIPDGLAGVSAKSEQKELAFEFYTFLFGRELQDMDLPGGFPVNMASFDSYAENPYKGRQPGFPDNFAGSVVTLTDEGEMFSLELIWPDEEQFRELKEMVSGTSVISMGDPVIEEAVLESGQKALDGEISVQEAVREIVSRSAIYLAE